MSQVWVSRRYCSCSNCHAGQVPADAELDIAYRGLPSGARRVEPMLGHGAPFDHRLEQMNLVGLEDYQQIGGTYSRGRRPGVRARGDPALGLDVPVVAGVPTPILYVQMQWAGVRLVKKETWPPGEEGGLSDTAT